MLCTPFWIKSEAFLRGSYGTSSWPPSCPRLVYSILFRAISLSLRDGLYKKGRKERVGERGTAVCCSLSSIVARFGLVWAFLSSGRSAKLATTDPPTPSILHNYYHTGSLLFVLRPNPVLPGLGGKKSLNSMWPRFCSG